MNPTVLAMMPANTNNQMQQTNPKSSNSNTKFGTVLESAISSGLVVTESESSQSEFSADQIKEMKDLLAFLKIDSLPNSEEDQSAIAELLASFLQVDLSKDLQLKLDESQDVNQQLSGILTEFMVKIEDIQSNGVLNTQDIKQILSEISPELLSVLTKVDSLDSNGWSKLDVNGAANVLKLAKLQDLLHAQNNLSEDATVIQKEIKNLLENITDKLDKWVGTQPIKSGNEAAFGTLLENGTNKSLDVVKQAFTLLHSTDAETSDETVSNGLTLKTAESNTQGSGLPFQMTKLEQYVLTASKNGQSVDVEQFVKSFENILSKANFSNTNGVQKLLIRLNPENLGSLRIELIQKDGAMVAKILATTAQAKDLLDRQLQGLKQAFTNQSISVEKIEISQQISTFNAERFAPRDQEQQHEQRQQQTQQELNEDEETDFTDRFEEALLNIEV